MTSCVRIAFRADASSQIGTGHVMRCLALADELRSRGARTRFLCRSLPGSLPADIRSRNHELAILPGGSGTDLDPEADAAATIAVLSDAPPWNWLVADHYGLDERWETPVRTMARKIFAIDDLADRRHDADLLLDQGLHPQGADRYARLVPPGCRMVLGPTFAQSSSPRVTGKPVLAAST
jgi:UDP-2,4-diacetamido-2,4,6-trideoxy-beta-L-altropyranose hydrolase